MALLVINNYNRDLTKPLTVERYAGVLASNDAKAHQFKVTVSGQTLTGATIYGYFVNSADQTVVLSGSVSNNAATVTLTNACYAVAGNFQLVIRATSGDVTSTLLIVAGVVHTTQTQTLVDDSNVIPSITELLAQIAACEAAARRAETFAGLAPYIDASNYHWMVYSSTAGVYQDTGVVAKGPQGERGADGTGAGTITGVSIDGVSVAASGVANIVTVDVAAGANGVPSASGVYDAINAAVGDVESALASL